MTRFAAGDDVIVDFNGREHIGEVLRHCRGDVWAVIGIDPVWDYGLMSARLAPRSIVCVPDKRVRHADPTCDK